MVKNVQKDVMAAAPGRVSRGAGPTALGVLAVALGAWAATLSPHRGTGGRDFFSRVLALLFLVVGGSWLFSGCARMGSPDGGWFDDTPPHVVRATPADRATGVTSRKVAIYFNEYIKIEDAQNKVIVSPPQLEQAEIKDAGRRIIVELKDSLKPNTTYTIDFSDAISDNNEGNPMGNYTYSFSTGSEIDTLEVSGYVLSASDLEPVKGILVGLYPAAGTAADSTGAALPSPSNDSILRKQPMVRISRTDSRGRFVVKGVAPGTYRACALQDADGDYLYSQKSELVAFNPDTFTPTSKPDTRQDTIWRDSLHIDNIVRVGYTHFLPDDLTLLAFSVPTTERHLLKTERQSPEKLSLYFTYGDSLPPVVRGLNFDATDAYILEASEHLDTLHYWLRDTALVNQDTLRIELQFQETDTTGLLVARTDTIELLPKLSYEKRKKEEEKLFEKWQKEQEKKKKRGERYDSIMPVAPLELRVLSKGTIDPDENIGLESRVPLLRADTAGIHLYSKIDTLWYRAPFLVRPVPGSIRKYELLAEWKPGTEYSLEIDSAAFESIYGVVNNPMKQGINVGAIDDYSTLVVSLDGAADTSFVVELLSKSDVAEKRVRVDKNRQAEFFFVRPGEYYLRAFADRNANGRWDTGDYDAGLQPEAVYYYPEVTECKAKWDITRHWNINAYPRYLQKPADLMKQKPEKERKRQNRNLERAKQMGLKYMEETTGVRL